MPSSEVDFVKAAVYKSLLFPFNALMGPCPANIDRPRFLPRFVLQESIAGRPPNPRWDTL